MDDPVLAAIRRSVVEVLPEVDGQLVTEDRSLTDLGANSIDRVDVVTMTMDDLGVTVPVVRSRISLSSSRPGKGTWSLKKKRSSCASGSG